MNCVKELVLNQKVKQLVLNQKVKQINFYQTNLHFFDLNFF